MNIILKRFEFGDTYTIGRLYVNNVYQCFTLEDAVRDTKIAGTTAIGEGTFKVVITRSNRFGKDMPLLLNVPNYEGVRIHSGNTSKDTEGCIILGETWDKGDFVGGSRVAYNKFFTKLKEGLENGVVSMTVE